MREKRDCRRVIRVYRERASAMGSRCCRAALQAQHGAEVAVRLRVVRIVLQRPPIARLRLVEPPKVQQGIAQIIVRLGKSGLQSQGLTQSRNGGIDMPTIPLGISQVVPDLCEIRPHLQRPA